MIGDPAHPTSEPSFEVRLDADREVVRVEAVGQLDLAAVPELRERVSELIAVGFDRVVIDLRALSFIDSSGLALLVFLTGEARREGWRLSLIAGCDAVMRVFALIGIEEQLPFVAATDPLAG